MADATAVATRRPLGITAISVALMVSAMVLLARTLAMHVGGLTGVGRMVAVLTFILLAIGLWKMHSWRAGISVLSAGV